MRLLKLEVAAICTHVYHALRGFYELAIIMIVLHEVLCLEISNLARQLKFNPEVGDDDPEVSPLTATLWFRRTELTITGSTSSARGPINDGKNVAGAKKQLESMVYRLTQERGRWPFLTPRLENVTNKTKESASLLIKQKWEVLQDQLELSERREVTVGTFVTSANETTIAGFLREHATGESKTNENKSLRLLSPCWEKKYTDGIFYAGNTTFEAFV